MPTVSRRRFLKITTAGAGVAAATGLLTNSGLNPLAANPEATGKVEKIPTYCDVCFWKCGAIAYVRDGKLWKVEGNPEDPLSRGRLCPRGTGGVGAHYDPDRLRSPLMRKSERGEEKWVEVTWDENTRRRSIRGVFAAGETYRLEIRLGRLRKNLSLKWTR